MSAQSAREAKPLHVVPYNAGDGFMVLCGVVEFDLKQGPVLRHCHPLLESIPLSAGLRRAFEKSLREAVPFASLPEGKYNTVDNVQRDGGDAADPSLDALSGWAAISDDGGPRDSWTFLLYPEEGDDSSQNRKEQVLFGVTHFCTMPASNQRGREQCGVVAIAKAPVLGMLQARLRSVAALCVQPHTRFTIVELFDSLNRTPIQKLGPQDIFAGVPLGFCISQIQAMNLMRLLRTVLLEGRVLLYSQSPVIAANAVLCIASLNPGELAFGLGRPPSAALPLLAPLRYRWRRFGLPLSVFHTDMILQPAATMRDLGRLQAVKGFLVGTTNQMLRDMATGRTGSSLRCSCVFDLDSQSFLDIFEPTSPGEGVWRSLSNGLKQGMSVLSLEAGFGYGLAAGDDKAEAAFADLELASHEDLIFELEQRCTGNPGNAEFEGSDAWVRQQFGNYFVDLLGSVRRVLDEAGFFRTSRSPREVNWRAICKELVLEKFGEKWLRHWAETKSFRSWYMRMVEDQDFWRARPADGDGCGDSAALGERAGSPLPTSPQTRQLGALEKAIRSLSSGMHRKLVEETITYDDGDTYAGTVLNGKREGHGAYTDSTNGYHYIGSWVNDRREGKGTLASPDGAFCYDGEWKADARTGQGSLSLRGVLTYIGSFLDGQFHGTGSCCYNDGAVYEGEFRCGKRHGAGKITATSTAGLGSKLNIGLGLAFGSSYIGEFQADLAHGHGHCVYVDGSVYMGQWTKGLREGHGRWEHAHPKALASGEEDKPLDGDSWEKQVVASEDTNQIAGGNVEVVRDPKLTGEKWSGLDGACVTSYEGTWQRNRWQGVGTVVLSTGDRYEGSFAMGKPLPGNWVITFANDDQYSGICRHVLPTTRGSSSKTSPPPMPVIPHGRGTVKYTNGDVYTGEFTDGCRSGEGICIYASGDIFKGFWADDEPFAIAGALEGLEDVALDPKEPKREPRSPAASACMTVEDVAISGPFHGMVSFDDGVYIGPFIDGKRHGKGEFVWRATGMQYIGFWFKDRMHGNGTLVSGDGCWVYEGQFDDGERSGQGQYSFQGHESYVGAFKKGLYHGRGVLHVGQNYAYDGEWSEGVKSGLGKESTANGEQYTGEFAEDFRNGTGDCQYSDGSVYSGSWSNGKRHGEGTWKASVDDLAETDSQKPQKDARGGQLTDEALKLHPEDGRKVVLYGGAWLDDRWHGLGEAVLSCGARYEGPFVRGNAIDGDWAIHYADSIKAPADNQIAVEYVGRCTNCVPDGEGIMKYRSGDIYTGSFRKGIRCGRGVAVFANGERFEGLWADNHIALNGQGTLTLADGTVHQYISPSESDGPLRARFASSLQADRSGEHGGGTGPDTAWSAHEEMK
mmetsp:Transcript_17541/g.66754  ORF Transcript_17541/g.66754 Transcript_17541/m.66754 type:complete len:1361 (-) Transcript_17541:88-4170(-)